MNAQEIQGWVNAAISAFSAAASLDELKNARLLHSGDKSSIAGASRTLGSLSPDEKASLGKIIGDAKTAIAEALGQATLRLENERDQKMLAEEVVDITLPVRRTHRGGLHPITIIKNDISDFFIEQGFSLE
jgi:phenylalanyl-tRNA synthetase alpha chain